MPRRRFSLYIRYPERHIVSRCVLVKLPGHHLNRGNRTFEDVTAKALVGGAYGPALGVSAADVNGDG